MKTNPNDLAFSCVQDSVRVVNVETEVESMRITKSGLTKREYFAAMAMQSLIRNSPSPVAAEVAVMAADALIIALNK